MSVYGMARAYYEAYLVPYSETNMNFVGSRFVKPPGPKYPHQNQREVSENSDETNDDDGNKKV